MRDEEDLYAILQVHPAAEPEIVEAAYRRLARMYHPDVNKSPHAHAIMTRINRAYEILKDPPKRAQYDLECAYRQRQAQPDAERQAQAEYERRERHEQAQRQAQEERRQREQARRQAQEERRQREQAERERHEQAQRMQRERQAQHGSARRYYVEWEDERSDTTQKLLTGHSLLAAIGGAIAFGICFGVIAGGILFPFSLVGWGDAGEFIVVLLNLILLIGAIYIAIAVPFAIPSSGFRRFVRVVGNIMFLLISFVAMALVVGPLLESDASNNIILPAFSFFIGAAFGFLRSLYSLDDG